MNLFTSSEESQYKSLHVPPDPVTDHAHHDGSDDAHQDGRQTEHVDPVLSERLSIAAQASEAHHHHGAPVVPDCLQEQTKGCVDVSVPVQVPTCGIDQTMAISQELGFLNSSRLPFMKSSLSCVELLLGGLGGLLGK